MNKQLTKSKSSSRPFNGTAKLQIAHDLSLEIARKLGKNHSTSSISYKRIKAKTAVYILTIDKEVSIVFNLRDSSFDIVVCSKVRNYNKELRMIRWTKKIDNYDYSVVAKEFIESAMKELF